MRPIGRVTGVQSFISGRHGKFYVALAPLNDREVLGVSIMGPYKTEHEANEDAAKWEQHYAEQMHRGGDLTFTDMTTVPDDVRASITASIIKALRKPKPPGVIFGKTLQ